MSNPTPNITTGLQSESVLPSSPNYPRIRDVAAEIATLDNTDAPVATLLKHPQSPLRRAACTSMKIEWQERQRFPWITSSSTGYSSGATSITVAAGNGPYGRTNDLVLITRTGEMMQITAVATDTWTVTRGWAGTTAAAINSGDEFLIVGSAYTEQNTLAVGDIRTNWPTFQYNYTEIFRTALGWSNSLKASNLYTGDVKAQDLRYWGEEHMRKIERALMWGQRYQSGDARALGGILSFIATNVTAVGGTLTESAWEDFNQTVFNYGNPKRVKVCLVSRLLRTVINRFAGVRLLTRSADTSYGLRIEEYQGPHGLLLLITHPILQGNVYNGYAVVLDPMSLIYRWLEGNGIKRDTQLITTGDTPVGQDGEVNEYLTECSLQFVLEQANGYLSGVTG